MNKTVSRVLWIVAGVLLIVAGGACMLHPGATLSGLSFLLGMAMLFSGAVDIIIVDSVAALVPKAEIDGDMGDSHVGLQAVFTVPDGFWWMASLRCCCPSSCCATRCSP